MRVVKRARPEGAIVLRLERDGSALSGARDEAWPALVLPLDSTVIELGVGTRTERIDRSTFALMPAKQKYRLKSISPAPRVLTLLLTPRALKLAADEYAPYVELPAYRALCAELRVFPRTRWVDELSQRYLFEREVCHHSNSAAAVFLETELSKEVFFLGQDLLQRRARVSVVHQGNTLARAAQQVIEAGLFTPLRVEAIAAQCHASESTLLRAFRGEFGVAPAAYIRTRRLDEALLLLESGRYSVSEVAARVGYDSPAAFSSAFTGRFGESPSRARKKTG